MSDRLWAQWWDATRSARLLVQRCAACDELQHYPRALCTHCGSTESSWFEVSGHGTVDTWTTVHRAPDGRPVPYVVARIALAEGPMMLSNVVDCPPSSLRSGLPVRLHWTPLPDGRQLPVFRLADTSTG